MLKLRPYEVYELRKLLNKIDNGSRLCICTGIAGEDFEPLMHELIVCCIDSVVADNFEEEDD